MSSLFDTVKSICDEAVEQQVFPGFSVLVWKDGGEKLYYENGFRDIAAGAPLHRDSIFHLYSLSKVIAGVAAMRLLEQGKYSLYDPVSRYIPSFEQMTVEMPDGSRVPPKTPLRIKHLFSMQSGLVYSGSTAAGKEMNALIKQQEQAILRGEELSTFDFVSEIGKGSAIFHPGTSWTYGTSTMIFGAIAEVITGKTYGQFLEDEIFTPLGMKDTGFYVPPEKQDRLVKRYIRTAEKTLQESREPNLGVPYTFERKARFEAAGEGLLSTTNDIARFAEMLVNGGTLDGRQILKPATMRYFTSPSLTDAELPPFWKRFESMHGYNYANFIRIMQYPGASCMLAREGAFGWDGWCGPYLEVFPREKMFFLLMTQKNGSGTNYITQRLKNVVQAELLD